MREIAPLIEDRGIDEIYIDLTDVPGVHDDGGRARGAAISRPPCASAPASPARSASRPTSCSSKIASELDKPNGLTLLGHADIAGAHLAAARRARSTASARRRREKLAALGLHTIGDIAGADPACLVDALRPAASAPGCTRPRTAATSAPVVTESEPVSMSRETTFDRDLHAGARPRRARRHLHAICAKQLAGDLARKGYVGSTHRHQAALRRLQDRDARPDLAGAHLDARRDPPRRRPVPEARRPDAPAAPARRARERAGDASPTWSRRSPPPSPTRAARPPRRASRPGTAACRCSTPRRSDRRTYHADRRAMTVITSIEDLRVLAKQRVPRMFYDYADSGLWTERHLPRQRERLPEDQAAPARGRQHGEPHARAPRWSAGRSRCRWRSRRPA